MWLLPLAVELIPVLSEMLLREELEDDDDTAAYGLTPLRSITTSFRILL